MTNPHIPHYLLGSVLQCQRLPGDEPRSRAKYTVLTKFRHLHIVRQQNVLATCDLSTVLVPIAAHHNRAENIVLDTRITYTAGQPKRIHILLLVGHQFVLVNKSSATDVDTLAIAHTEADIQTFRAVPADDPVDPTLPSGQLNIRLTTIAGNTIETPLREMASAADSRRAGPAAVSHGTAPRHIGPIGRTLQQSIWVARNELAVQRLQCERLAQQLVDRQRFGPASQRGHSVDEKMMLARYGDVWRRAHRDRLVIGVPVFNCTYKR